MNDTTPRLKSGSLIDDLIAHRDRLDSEVQAAYAEMVDILSLATRNPDAVFAQAAAIQRASSRVAVADTAVRLLREGASLDETLSHLGRAFTAVEPTPAEDLAARVRAEGHRHELLALERLMLRTR